MLRLLLFCLLFEEVAGRHYRVYVDIELACVYENSRENIETNVTLWAGNPSGDVYPSLYTTTKDLQRVVSIDAFGEHGYAKFFTSGYFGGSNQKSYLRLYHIFLERGPYCGHSGGRLDYLGPCIEETCQLYFYEPGLYDGDSHRK